jgi:WD40 repeat protein
MRWLLRVASALLVTPLLAAPAAAQEAQQPEAEKKISFHRDVRPILQLHCQGCHQPAKRLGDLVLTNYADLKRGGETEEPGFIPGKPDESELIKQLLPQDGQPPAMPKERPPLSEKEIATLRQWIAQGAEDDTPMADRPVVDMAHPPVYVLPPVITSVAYSPDGSLIAVSGYHEVLLHKSDGSEIVARLVGLSERIESAVFSPDGKFMAVTGGSPGRFGEVQIWEVEQRKLVLSAHVGYDTVYGASWSHDGKLVAFGCGDNNVRAIEAETGKQVLQQGTHTDWVLDTFFSTDSSHLVSVSRDRSLRLTEVATQRFVDNITSITPGALKGGLNSVDRHPTKDEVVVGGADGAPKIFRMYRDPGKPRQIGDDFNLIRTFESMPGRVCTVAYNHDGTSILAGSSFDDAKAGVRLGELRAYSAADGKLLWKSSTSIGSVYCADYRPDGAQIAAAGFDGKVRIFDAASGQVVTEFSAVPLSPQ